MNTYLLEEAGEEVDRLECVNMFGGSQLVVQDGRNQLHRVASSASTKYLSMSIAYEENEVREKAYRLQPEPSYQLMIDQER